MKILRVVFLLLAVGDSFKIGEESSAVQPRSKRGLRGIWAWLRRMACDPFHEPCDV